VTRYCGVV